VAEAASCYHSVLHVQYIILRAGGCPVVILED